MNTVYKHILISILALIIIAGCARGGSHLNWDEDPIDPKFKPVPTKTDTHKFEPLAWEKTVKSGKEWSQMVYSVIENEEPELLQEKMVDDIHEFCPKYNQLNNPQRLNFWGQLFAAMAKRESSWVPTTQATESTFKYVDSVTGQAVTSEGLLQLSYQDEKSYRLDCGFDWDHDRKLAQKSTNRTILHPYLNLRCGIKIMSILVQKHHILQLPKGKAYWSVLYSGKDSNTYIKSQTKSLTFCK